jgi:hypothetical protein
MRKVLATMVLLGASLLSAPLALPAAAATGPTVSASPAAGLRDSDETTVTGAGWTSALAGIVTCPADVFAGAPTDANARFSYFVAQCPGLQIANVANGSFTYQYSVTRPAACGAVPKDCAIYALGEAGSGVFSTNSAPLTFLSAGPQSAADCNHGGWANPNFVDEQGHAFASRRACRQYVERYLLNARVNGTVRGPLPAHPAGCSGRARFALTLDSERGPDKQLALDVCIATGGSVTGTFRLQYPHGGALLGFVDGTTPGGDALDATLTVSRGTKRLCGVTGTLSLAMFAFFDTSTPGMFGTVESHLVPGTPETCHPKK